MLFFSWNKSKEEKKKERETKTRNKKKAKKKDKKEGRKKRKRERQRKWKWKRGMPKKAWEKERETLKINQKLPFLGGKTGFFYKKQRKEQKKKNKKNQQKTNKEGLGPSEGPLGHLTWPLNLISQSFPSLGGCPKFPFFDNLAQKACTPKTL